MHCKSMGEEAAALNTTDWPRLLFCIASLLTAFVALLTHLWLDLGAAAPPLRLRNLLNAAATTSSSPATRASPPTRASDPAALRREHSNKGFKPMAPIVEAGDSSHEDDPTLCRGSAEPESASMPAAEGSGARPLKGRPQATPSVGLPQRIRLLPSPASPLGPHAVARRARVASTLLRVRSLRLPVALLRSADGDGSPACSHAAGLRPGRHRRVLALL